MSGLVKKMSRVGKKPIKIVSGVKVEYKDSIIEVSGKAGKLSRKIPPTLALTIKGEEILIANKSERKKALHGLYRSLVQNMVTGVSEGYSKKLELQGVGYRAQAKGDTLTLQLGFSHPVNFKLPQGITAKVEANTKITLTGADNEVLGVAAANIRKIRPPEPYKGKGVRFAGEVITLKQGKTAGK